MKPQLNNILARPDVWQASSSQQQLCASSSTGYAKLDAALHQGGWPVSSLVELFNHGHGIGEWQLLIPSLVRQHASQAVCLLIAPPFLPYPPALEQSGISSQDVLVTTPASLADMVWCTVQALKSRACATVIVWLGEHKLQTAQLRKLQLAARGSGSLTFLYRHQRFAQQHSPATLRLEINQQGDAIALNILKQPGGWAGQHVLLPRNLPWLHQALPVASLPSWTSANRQQSANSLPIYTDLQPQPAAQHL
jgi:hypothetical protein